jgi:hypothetical protein
MFNSGILNSTPRRGVSGFETSAVLKRVQKNSIIQRIIFPSANSFLSISQDKNKSLADKKYL